MRTRTEIDVADRLVQWGLAGRIPNSQEANLRAIDRLLKGETFYTFGIRRIEKALALGMLDQDAVIRLMAEECGCSREDFLQDPGFINPVASGAALERMAAALARAVSRRWTVALGTGHPGAMLGCYTRLAEWLTTKGCPIAKVPGGAGAGVDWFVDEIGGVALTSDGCGILHGHSTRPMEAVIEAGPVDLVIADHGHAGAALNAAIPCLAIMDTNDPALAVAAHLEAPDLVVVPLYDNRPNSVTRQLADLVIALAEA